MRVSRILTGLALLATGASSLGAQTREEPSLIFSIGLGLTTGQRLWEVTQPLPVAGGLLLDTVGLGRYLRPSLTATVGMTYFRSPRLGYAFEVGYFGVGSEQRCSPPAAYAPEPNQVNSQGCTRAQGLHKETSVVGFQGGLMYRATPGTFQPYARATAGLGLMGNSFIETSGPVVVPPNCTQQSPCDLILIDEKSNQSFTWVGTLAAGISITLGPAYRLRMEARDLITSVPAVTGPADPNVFGQVGATSRRMVHVPTFTFGLDLAFERRHTRRY